MRDIVDWLIGIEELAGDLYAGAAEQFKDDDKLAGFLRHLAEDEAWHYHVMRSAALTLSNYDGPSAQVSLDAATKEKIETPIRTQYSMLSMGTLTRESLIDCIITSEYSEWNYLFVYVVNILKQQSKEFSYVASTMQNHLQMIKNVIQSFPDGDRYLEKIKKIPEIWEKRVLVVEDYEPVAVLLASLFKEQGKVDIANNGLEGLKKVNLNYYDLIISDIDMPEMSGTTFFREALTCDPKIKERFIFLTASPEAEEFSRMNNVHYLDKPFDITQLMGMVIEIMGRTTP